MSTIKVWLVFSASLVLCMAYAQTLRADLIVNGGFETGSFAPDWTTVGSVGTTTNSLNVFAGSRAAFMSSNHDELNQIVANTVIGQHYTLGFVVGNRSSSGANDMQVSWNGSSVLHLVNDYLAPTISPSPYAAPYSFTVTATATSTPLKFVASNSTSFWLLDQVTLVPVPEPGTAALAISALVLAAFGGSMRAARRRV